MSLIPEYILQTCIIRGMRALKKDLKLVDQLFRNLDQQGLNDIKQFLINETIDLCLNYPPTQVKVPAIVILLKSDSENSPYLGDSMGMEVPEEFSYEDVLGGVVSTATLGSNKLVEFGPYPVSAATNNTITTDINLWNISQYVGKNLTLDIVTGTGQGQSRNITANTQRTIMISGTWTVNPDNTSTFEVRKQSDEVLGEPSKLYNRTNAPVIERRGYLSQAQYQIQVVGSNAAQAIFLTMILKSIFLLAKIFMEGQGILNLKLNSTDFFQKPDYLPDLVYARALNLEFLYPFDIFEELSNVASSMTGAIEGTGLDGNIKIISSSVAAVPAYGSIVSI